MFEAATRILKRRAPELHEAVKRIWRGSQLPVPKRLNGKLTLVSPNLISASPTEPHVLRWIHELLRPGNTFFDAGAHYGWMSLAACHRVGAKGKVVAFEASPPLLECLQYNKHANRFQQLEIVAKAVSESEGQWVPFYVADQGDSFLNSLVDHPMEPVAGAPQQKATIKVQTVTLDEFSTTRKLQPDLVKIDVEGAELLVLRGCRRILAECRPRFIVAVHPTWLPAGQNATELFELFRGHGYRVTASETVRYDGADFGDYVFAPDGQRRATSS
jgi:FkbM family methyltransferase